MRNLIKAALATTAIIVATAPSAGAAVTFDPATGTGFVGKGDVQTALGWNNKQLQTNADSAVFTYQSTTVSEVSWTCTNTRNENTQERERTTTTESTGVNDSVTRDSKKQVTGFNLTGFASSSSTSTTEGNQLNSCPTNWVLTSPAGDPEIISSTSALFVNGVALQ